MEVSNVLSYLGMQVKLKEECVFLDFFYIENPKDLGNLEPSETLVNKNVFRVRGDSKLLEEEVVSLDHSSSAILLYLSKQARPDIITVVGFLCTRVRAPTEEDQQNLDRLLGYLVKTKDYIQTSWNQMEFPMCEHMWM
jgi:hypothetical protein